MNILIIGGTGVLSSAVTLEALKHGISVTMINRGNRPIPKNVEHIKSDKNDFTKISRELENRQFDAVMDFLCSSDKDVSTSLDFYHNYTKHYFYISSCAVYNARNSNPCTENSPKIEMEWEYSIRKWIGECRLIELAKKWNTHYTIIRPSITYDNTRIPYGISPKYGFHWTLAARMLSGKPILRWNGGENRCSMMRVEDFAVGVIGLVGNTKAYDEVFNVCGDESPTYNDVLEYIGEYIGIKPVLFDITSDEYAREVPSRAGEIIGGRSIDLIISNDKLKSVVPSFRQTISLREGIRMTLEAYKNQGFQKGIDWRFDAETDRIIANKCKRDRLDVLPYNIGFVDYLGNATLADRETYLKEYNKSLVTLRKERFVRSIKNMVRKGLILYYGYSDK